MKIKKNLFAVSAAAVLAVAFLITGCSARTHEVSKAPVELSEASVGDIRWYVIAKTETGYTLLSEKPVIKQAFTKAGYHIFTSTWEESTVRAWLNDKFYNTFTE
ncbi:MAG: DUF6273 domain-containing protein, partial [Lachnospiraceae bacterium]|nr:DUF6273 domain-containing protein [Lachnospiraceae bacterium]